MSNWYLQNGKESDVVISTRIRLSRNIQGFNFINKCTVKEKQEILDKVETIVPNLGYGLKMLKLKDMDMLTKKSLVEKHIISPNLIKGDSDNSAILINNEENICIMINENDHICIQVFSEGFAVEDLLNLAIEIDKRIEKYIPYDYSEKYGYLTANLTNIGTAMRISTMVHLHALAQTGNASKVLRLVSNLGLSVRGNYGEGSESKGNIYQLSNSRTLGISEKEIAKNVKSITEKVIEQERTAREYLGKTGIDLENKLYRAFGLLTYSKILNNDECIDLLSNVKLGTDMGIIKELDDSKIKKLYLYTKSNNMQKYYGQAMDIREQNIKRPEIIKQIINE